MEYVDKYEQLVKLITDKIEIDGVEYSLKDEFDKVFVRGNKTAGTRLRKAMQIIKQLSQEVRDDVQTYKESL
jgi:hypothetical protein